MSGDATNAVVLIPIKTQSDRETWMANGFDTSSAMLANTPVKNPERMTTVQSIIWRRDRLILLRSSISAPRQTPVLPRPAMMRNATNSGEKSNDNVAQVTRELANATQEKR